MQNISSEKISFSSSDADYRGERNIAQTDFNHISKVASMSCGKDKHIDIILGSVWKTAFSVSKNRLVMGANNVALIVGPISPDAKIRLARQIALNLSKNCQLQSQLCQIAIWFKLIEIWTHKLCVVDSQNSTVKKLHINLNISMISPQNPTKLCESVDYDVIWSIR